MWSPAGMPVPCGSKGPHLPSSCVVQRSDVCRRGGFNAGALVAESGNARVLATCVVCEGLGKGVCQFSHVLLSPCFEIEYECGFSA